MLVRRPGGAYAAVLTCLALDASAETSREPVRIEYQGGAGCPSDGQVQQDILGRTRRARTAQLNEAARLFRLSVRFAEGRAIGRVEIVAKDGASTVREVVGRSCGEAVEALTLVARIAIDPDQTPRSAASIPESESVPRPTAPAEERSPKPGEARSKESSLESGATPSASAHEPGPPPHLRPAVGAEVFLTTLISPGVAPGASIFGDFVGSPPHWLGMRASFRVGMGGETETSAGAARFTFVAARAGVCLPRLPLSARWTLCPTAAVEAGALRASGFDTLGARSDTRPWFAAALGLRLEWSIASNLFADLEGEGSVPLVRDQFVFDEPPTTIHETAAIGVNLAIGLGYRFP